MIAARYFGIANLDGGPDSLLFRAVMLLAHFTVLSAVLLGVVFVLALLRAPVWLVVPLGSSLAVATLLALLIDTQVYQLYRFHINAGVMNLLLGGAAQETFGFSASMYLQGAAIACAIVLAQSVTAWLWWRYVLHNPGSLHVARALTLALLGAVVSFHAVHIWADATAHESLLEQTDVLPLRYAATAKRSLRALGFDVRSQPGSKLSRGQDRGGLVYPLYPLTCQPSRTPPNIIVIVIDSWRSDALNADVTPNLDRFARSAVRFTDHHSGGNGTRIGVFSALLRHPGYLLAPHASRATGTGVHHAAPGEPLRRARVSQRAPVQSGVRSHRVRRRRRPARALGWQRFPGARPRSDERFSIVPRLTLG